MALLPLSFALQVWAAGSGDDSFWRLAAGALVIGLLGSVPALISGFLDFLTLPDGHAAGRTAEAHLCAMGLAVSLFLGAWLALRAPSAPASWVPLLCSGTGTLVLLVGGWWGGQLVYRHGIGKDDTRP
jgi:uncharacterized membrane protein